MSRRRSSAGKGGGRGSGGDGPNIGDQVWLMTEIREGGSQLQRQRLSRQTAVQAYHLSRPSRSCDKSPDTRVSTGPEITSDTREAAHLVDIRVLRRRRKSRRQRQDSSFQPHPRRPRRTHKALVHEADRRRLVRVLVRQLDVDPPHAACPRDLVSRGT